MLTPNPREWFPWFTEHCVLWIPEGLGLVLVSVFVVSYVNCHHFRSSISNLYSLYCEPNVINYVHSMVSCEFSPQFEAHQKMLTVNSWHLMSPLCQLYMHFHLILPVTLWSWNLIMPIFKIRKLRHRETKWWARNVLYLNVVNYSTNACLTLPSVCYIACL